MTIKATNSDQDILIDKQDYDKVSKYKWFLFYKKKNKRKSYVKSTVAINGRQVVLHRFLLGITDSKIQVDHINGNPLDNRRSNLRECTITQNNRNKSSHVRSTSKYLGVSFDKSRNKWAVSLCYNRKRVYRGRFNDEKNAALAYNREAKKYFGEFANLNVVT